jgi:hypothetical protein
MNQKKLVFIAFVVYIVASSMAVDKTIMAGEVPDDHAVPADSDTRDGRGIETKVW